MIFLVSVFALLLKDNDNENTNVDTSFEEEIDNLNDTIDKQNAQINELKSQVSEYESNISELNLTIENNNSKIEELQYNKNSLQTTVAQLTSINESNSQEITRLQTLKSEYEQQIAKLDNTNTQNANLIASLQSNISTINSQLQNLIDINSANVLKISSLNAQITQLNNDTMELTSQNVELSNSIVLLNAEILKLNNSILIYQQFITGLETDSQAVAIFELNGSIYSIQLVEKGSKVSVESPSSTEYVVFNGWLVDNSPVNLTSYIINENTTFVADITCKYDVKFVVDSQTVNSQIVSENEKAVLPSTPSKENAVFLGWTLNGVDVIDINSYPITENTTFIAKFVSAFTVQFVDGEETVCTQTVNSGEFATDIERTSTTYKVFEGWAVNGVIVDVDSYSILADTTFTAVYTYKYDVTFSVDSTDYDSQIITSGSYATVPVSPTKDGYVFLGWSLDGSSIVNVSTTQITSATTFIALFAKVHTVTFVDGTDAVSTQSVVNGQYANDVVRQSTAYKVFNGWSVDGEIVDISSYHITSDTTFVADYTNKYDVTFIVDSDVISSQIIEENKFATIPVESPFKEGYIFIGWSVDGEVVSVDSYSITKTTIFVAEFKKLYTVTFMSDNQEISTQQAADIDDVVVPSNPTKEEYKFVGWSTDGQNVVELSSYVLSSDTIFYAVFETLWEKLNTEVLSEIKEPPSSFVPFFVTLSFDLSNYIEEINNADKYLIKGNLVVYNSDFRENITTRTLYFEYDGENFVWTSEDYENTFNIEPSLSSDGTFLFTFSDNGLVCNETATFNIEYVGVLNS